MSLYGQGIKVFDYWRNFELLDEIPIIEAVHMPWMGALWVQALAVFILLIVGIVKLYFESEKLNNDSIKATRQNLGQSNGDNSCRTLYIDGLYRVCLLYTSDAADE